jgi:hypothetical protein
MSDHVQLPTLVKVTGCLGSLGGEWGLQTVILYLNYLYYEESVG